MSISENHARLDSLHQHIQQTIVGQDKLINRILISLLTGGHLLLEGLPGLAKTTVVKALANGIHSSFQRIQFTPDLMPADLTGNDVYDQQKGEFRFMPGPLFHEIILADEINRAPPKVQSALLEAMEEQQITIGMTTRSLPDLFLVIATQNPFELAGTYPLPEAQLDRFQLHFRVEYPDKQQELDILNRQLDQHFSGTLQRADSKIKPEHILAMRKEVAEIHVEQSIKNYVVEIITATRDASALDPELAKCINFGASPRASKALLYCAMAHAWLDDRDYVLPDDVTELCPDVLRHRIQLSYEAIAGNIDASGLIERLLKLIPTP